MNDFASRAGALWCEGVAMERLAREVGTPLYVYSKATLLRHLFALERAFRKHAPMVCYSVKANSNVAVLRVLAQHGCGFDIVSLGELERVRRAGGEMGRVVFSGVGKSDEEMEAALRANILLFNVESGEELLRLNRIATRLTVRAPFAIRVNPDIDAKTHRSISTGLHTSKFGVPVEEAWSLYRRSRSLRGLRARGIDCHIGSQLTDLRPLRRAVETVARLHRSLRSEGMLLTHVDVGGGLGVSYATAKPPALKAYARAIEEPLADVEATLVLEPGRVLVASAGVLLTRVLYRKKTPERRFVVVDAGMNDLLRPALYQAFHDICPVRLRLGRRMRVDVVGPVCESSDVLGADRLLPPLQAGDVLAVMAAGAYGMSMASNYNSRPRPAEVLVDGASFRVVRAREILQELWRGETP